MLLLSLFVVLSVCLKPSRQSDATNNCQHLFAHDYRYTKSYELSEVANKVNGTIRLELAMVGKSDAHIRLTPHYFVESGDIYYEIVLGAGGNSYSTIRKKPRNYKDLDRQNTRGILSAYATFVAVVAIERDRISVYNKTGGIILTGSDTRVINVKYVSFGAWDGVSVLFTFGCQMISNNPQTPGVPQEEKDDEEEESLTVIERWRRQFLTDYDPFAVPIHTNDTLLVQIGVAISYLSLDSKEGLLTTRGTFNISWIDPKLKWNPEDYGGLNEMYFDARNIWRPDFSLLDTPKVEESPLKGNFMRVINSGQVIWKPSSELVTRCRSDETNHWPRDRHDCAIRLALYAHSDAIQLSPMSDRNEFSLDSVNSQDLDIELTSINSETVTEQPQISASPITFALKMSLKRRMNAFSVLFIIPLIAITALTHCGLYLPPSSNARNFMHSVTLVVLAVYLMMQERIVPQGRTIPLIMKLTSGAFMLTVVQLIYSTVICCLTQSKHPVPKKLVEFISAKWINNVIFCPTDIYDKFTNDQQERAPEPSPSCESQWLCVARFFDKLVQFVSLVFLGLLYIMLLAV